MKKGLDPLSILFFSSNFRQGIFDSLSIQSKVREELGEDDVQVCVSLKGFMQLMTSNETRPINNCLSVISVPAGQVVADEKDAGLYFLTGEEKRTTEDFQIHYSLIFKDLDSFLEGNFLRVVHPPYQNLYQLISSNAVMEEIIKEVSNILQTVTPNQEKAEFSRSMMMTPAQNPLMLYKQLRDNGLKDSRDRLLVHSMLNVMAFSPEFYQRMVEAEKCFKTNLLTFFNTVPLGLPAVVDEIIVNYLVEEAVDLAERRGYAYP